MRDQLHSNYTGKHYEVEHRIAGSGVQKVDGELISLDESGFKPHLQT